MFIGVYQLYLIFPLLVIARLYDDAPFSHRLSELKSGLLWLVGTATFAVFFSYVAKWLLVHEPALFPARVAAALVSLRTLP